MSSNSLLINTQKTQAILFTPKNKRKNPQGLEKQLMLNDSEIEITENANYLGIILDENLNFKPQFNSLYKKLTIATRALLTTRKLLNIPSKLLIYNSLFKSNLEYAAVAYFDKLTNTQIKKLTKLQKQALRFVFQTKPKVHTKKLFKATKIIPINQTFAAEATKLIFRMKHELTESVQPKAIKELLLDKTKNRTTRQSLDTSRVYSEMNQGLIYELARSWNNTSTEIRNSGNLFALKKQIIDSALQSIQSCKEVNCYICKIDSEVDYSEKLKKC